jgi:tetratricopeptide (TPR) repeat protein
MNYAFKDELNTARSWGFKSLNDPAFPNLPDEEKWPTYMQLAINYATEDILDSAEYYASFLKTYISKKLNPPGMLENSYRVLGLIAKKKKHYEEALDYYRRDTALAFGLAEVYEELKQTDSAIYYAKIGLEFATRKHFPPDVITCASILARLYQEMNPKFAYITCKYVQQQRTHSIVPTGRRKWKSVHLPYKKNSFKEKPRQQLCVIESFRSPSLP